MNCPNCNTEVKDGMKFCPKCGDEMYKIRHCKDCGTEIKDGMKFCPKCGKEMAQHRHCKDCGTELKEGMRFCQKCGKPYETVPSFDTVIQDDNPKYVIGNKMESIFNTQGVRNYVLISIVVLAFLIGYGIFSNTSHNSDSSNTEYQIEDDSENTINDNSNPELESANNELQKVTDKAYSILPKVEYVMNQYGYSSMGYLAASQNNPRLFSDFEDVISDYNRCLRKLIRLCEKNGLSEEANFYRMKQQEWEEGVLRVKGMY